MRSFSVDTILGVFSVTIVTISSVFRAFSDQKKVFLCGINPYGVRSR